jgi:hypothetical protein
VSEKPPQGAIEAGLFIRPAGGARPAAAVENFVAFAPVLALDDLNTALETTGFDGVDAGTTPPTEFSRTTSEVPTPAVVIAPPMERPIVEVRPSAAPMAVYESIQFLDYDDEEQDSFIQPEPEPEPPVLTELVAIALPKPAAPVTAKALHGFAAVSLPDTPVALPELALFTVRPRLVYRTNPFAPKPEPKQDPVPEAVQSAPPAEAPKPARHPTPPVVTRPAPPPAVKSAPNYVQRPAVAAAASAPVIKAEPARTEQAKPDPRQQERDKRPAAKPTPPPPAPARPVRDRSNAVPVEEVVQPAPAPAPSPAPKPKMVPIRKPEPLAPAAAALTSEFPMLAMQQSQPQSSKVRLGIAAAVIVVLAGSGYAIFSGGKSSANSIADPAAESTAGMVIGGGGWTTTWGADSPVNKGKQISIYRPSMTLPDYRLEFRGQIERKAMGWIFRAQDARNYYVMKLEMIKPGVNPVVALVKYAVIDGKETTRTQVMLPFDVKLGTIYQIRLDVKGDRFATYIQGKLVDHWTDDRIKLGGTGFYTEAGERSAIKSSQISYLK